MVDDKMNININSENMNISYSINSKEDLETIYELLGIAEKKLSDKTDIENLTEDDFTSEFHSGMLQFQKYEMKDEIGIVFNRGR